MVDVLVKNRKTIKSLSNDEYLRRKAAEKEAAEQAKKKAQKEKREAQKAARKERGKTGPFWKKNKAGSGGTAGPLPSSQTTGSTAAADVSVSVVGTQNEPQQTSASVVTTTAADTTTNKSAKTTAQYPKEIFVDSTDSNHSNMEEISLGMTTAVEPVPPSTATITTTTMTAMTSSSPSKPFFDLLLGQEALEIHDAVDAYEFHKTLVSAVTNLPELKCYYTFLATNVQQGLISHARATKLLEQVLQKLTQCCTTEDAFVAFEMILRKGVADGYIVEEDAVRYNNRAEVKRLEHAEFILDMKRAIEDNASRIQGLEGAVDMVRSNITTLDHNIRQVNQQQTQMKSALAFKLKVEGCVSMVRACLNAVSFGMAGELANVISLVFHRVVDFGDVAHLKTVIQASCAGDSGRGLQGDQLLDDLDKGVAWANETLDTATADLAEGELAESKLVQALKNGSPLAVVGFAATMARSIETKSMGGTGDDKTVSEFSTSMASSSQAEFTIWPDALFDEEMEDPELELHTAVKFSDEDELKKIVKSMMEEGDKEGMINRQDSQGRTAMDLASLTGQVKLMHILKKEPTAKFHFKAAAKMKKIAEVRSSKLEKYKQYVLDSLEDE